MPRGSSAARLFDLLASTPAGQVRSGQELALRCGVSRAAIWKQVAALRALGLPVRAQPGSGYRLEWPIEALAAERIAEAAALPGPAPAISVLWRCDSTNSECLRRAADLPSGAACLAEIQDAGRGRRGRAWHLPLGGGLALSVLWRFDTGMSRLGGLSLVAGVALMRALEDFGLAGCGLKWPNDAVACGAKFAGILVELGGDALGPCVAVIGVGVNLRIGAYAPAGAAGAESAWTDLARVAGGEPPGRNAFAGRLLARLVESLGVFERDGFAAFRDPFARYDVLAGHTVRVGSRDGVRSARALGVDAQGALRLRGEDGEFVVTSGEVSVRAGHRP